MIPSSAPVSPGLYQLSASDHDPAIFVYYLAVDDLQIPPPTLDEIFNQQQLWGWYVFTTRRISDAATFKALARAAFPDVTQFQQNLNPRGVVWLADPGVPAVYTDSLICAQSSPGPYQLRPLATPHTFRWSAFGLAMSTNVNVGFDPDTGQLILGADDPTVIQILYNSAPQLVGYYPPGVWNVVLPLSGRTAGTMSFQAGLDLGTLQIQFGCALAYFYPGSSGYTSLTYPVFAPVAPAQPSDFPGFNLRLDPLYPLDASRTRLALDLSGATNFSQNSQKLTSQYFRAINGATITLVPQDPGLNAPGSPNDLDVEAAGFGFCLAPAGPSVTSPPETVYYLAPVGGFLLQTVSGNRAASRRALTAGTAVRWMCGLFGQEFIDISTGDMLDFISGQPAYAPAFSIQPASDEAPADALTQDCTTSWVRYPVHKSGKGGYFSQPSASVFYAAAPRDHFPMAADALLSDLDDSRIFPAVPYGGIYAPQQSVTPPPGSIYVSFEASVLSSVRHAQLATPARGPVFRMSQPKLAGVTIPAARRGAARKAGVSTPSTALTPQGLVVNLDSAGEWLSVILARSPDNPNEYLQFNGAGGSPALVSPELSSTLMQNQLFLVVATPAALGQFENTLHLDRFRFQLAVGDGQTILVFKYNTSLSLADLIATPSLWAGTAVFVGDAGAVGVAQTIIRNAIEIAKQDADAPGAPFANFNRIAQDPSWTGILTFNCPIDGNGMPPDLQMLLGGIEGQLRAHHFGIESNHVADRSPNGDLQVTQSSLFGVIYYEGGATPSTTADYDYNVDTLTVVFSNSKISQLAVSVGLTMNRVFERAVDLVSGAPESPMIPNTMVIKGQYQSQDGVGTVLFSSDTAFIFKVPVPAGSTRVIEKVEVTHASLTPITTQPLGSPPGGTHMVASFGMAGQIFFAAEPFPNSDGLDLFSYGAASGGGLAFSGLTVYIDFDLDSQGKLAPGRTITLQPSLLSFAPDSTAIRPGSLLYSLPLQYSRFWYAPDGLTASKLGAVPINCLQLEGHGTVSSPEQTGPFPAVAASPHYALEYDLPLGSLGSLSDVTVGIEARLLLAWGPSSVVPDNDAAAVMVQLPAVFAGAGGFSLEGILRTTFGDANLLKVDANGPVYAILFNNIKFSVLGFSFPPGVLIDFVIFAGKPQPGQAANGSNIAWYLAAQPVPSSSSKKVLA